MINMPPRGMEPIDAQRSIGRLRFSKTMRRSKAIAKADGLTRASSQYTHSSIVTKIWWELGHFSTATPIF